jgi:hypothetical protein
LKAVSRHGTYKKAREGSQQRIPQRIQKSVADIYRGKKLPDITEKVGSKKHLPFDNLNAPVCRGR